MVTRHLTAALLLTAAACTSSSAPLPPPDPAPDPATPALPFDGRPGHRLQAVWYEAEGGAAIQQGWFDTQLGERCGFDWAADGRLRCLPISTFDARLLSCNAGACVSRFANRAYGRLDERGGCPTRARMFRRGALVAREGVQETHSVSEVVPDEFVGATVEPGAEPLAPLWLVAEDGARGLHAWRDGKNGFDCDFRDLDSNGRSRLSPELSCMPAWHGDRFSGGGPFSDSGCQTPLAWVADACPPSFVWGDRGACHGAPLALYRLGKPRERGYGRNPNVCEESGLPAGARYFEVEDALPPAELGSARTRLAGAGRIQTIVMSTASGDVRWGLWDREREAVCTPAPREGGTVCLPQADVRQHGLLLFADAACARPVVDESADCARPRLFADGLHDQLRTVGEPYAGPVFEIDALLRICRPSTRPTGAMYHLGPPLAPASFAPLHELRR